VADLFDDFDELMVLVALTGVADPAFQYADTGHFLDERAELFFKRCISPGKTVSREVNIGIVPSMLLIEATDGIRPYRVGDTIHPMVCLPVCPDIESASRVFNEVIPGIETVTPNLRLADPRGIP